MPRIKIGFDREMFDSIAQNAARRHISFAERVRELVEVGNETEQQEKGRSIAEGIRS